ncbi:MULTISPECIES: peptidylprolyl isomerase [unclassified Mycobacterium]|uniref:peptidylprolyl isomerase n=1 Tax=unclassified Mycobacterium TaxID=2642494 RepID=UPI0029C912C7|nr:MULTISPECIES: peptidylprolyl isomerase [unclassified Mycobacterium]
MTNPPPYGEFPPTPPSYGAGQGGYPGYGGFPGYPQARGTNTMAIVSLVSAFLFPPLGIVFGHISLSQLKRTNEEGKGLAIAGLAIGYVVTILSVIALVIGIVFTFAMMRWADDLTRYDSPYPRNPSATAFPAPGENLPPFKPPATLGSNCQYPSTTEPASKPVTPPKTGASATTPQTIPAKITTNVGVIGLTLDNAKTPCTVNNFTSLARQGFFNNTTCHRLTTSATLGVLQCGDPTGSGTGGPGYRFPNEYPTNQYRITDPALEQPVLYPRGTLAMANSGAGTNGSQFFLVYADSQLPPSYTVFGSIDSAGLTALDKVATGGVQGGGDDGKPVTGVTIESVQLN